MGNLTSPGYGRGRGWTSSLKSVGEGGATKGKKAFHKEMRVGQNVRGVTNTILRKREKKKNKNSALILELKKRESGRGSLSIRDSAVKSSMTRVTKDIKWQKGLCAGSKGRLQVGEGATKGQTYAGKGWGGGGGGVGGGVWGGGGGGVVLFGGGGGGGVQTHPCGGGGGRKGFGWVGGGSQEGGAGKLGLEGGVG